VTPTDPDPIDPGRSHPDRIDPDRTPGLVIAAVAAATVVVPFLAVYAILFIAHGIFVVPEQPDITTSRHGEAYAGFVVGLFLGLVLWGMNRMLNGANRVVFWLAQAITAGVSGYLLLDNASGERQIPAVVLMASVLALALSAAPPVTRWVRSAEVPAESGEADVKLPDLA